MLSTVMYVLWSIVPQPRKNVESIQDRELPSWTEYDVGDHSGFSIFLNQFPLMLN